MKFISFILIGCICITGCGFDWSEMPKFNTPVKVAEDELICPCPDKDVVFRGMTPFGPVLYLIKKGAFDDIKNNPTTMYREDYEEMMRKKENNITNIRREM